jgi:hypothetical protein
MSTTTNKVQEGETAMYCESEGLTKKCFFNPPTFEPDKEENMKKEKPKFSHCVTGVCPNAVLTFLLLVLTVAATTASAQTSIFVPANTSGAFGYPFDEVNPLVTAVTVSGPATITVTYVSGTVTWSNVYPPVGPDGVTCGLSQCSGQAPLSEAVGFGLKGNKNLAALIGIFVPAGRVNVTGFRPLDGTKDVAELGILPGGLFLIGKGKTFSVSEAGTLYLGINDYIVGDNSGGFNVTVSVE